MELRKWRYPVTFRVAALGNVGPIPPEASSTPAFPPPSAGFGYDCDFTG
jgi:hypothetical protein